MCCIHQNGKVTVDDVDSFLEYFRAEKLEKHSGWFEAIKQFEWCVVNTNSI